MIDGIPPPTGARKRQEETMKTIVLAAMIVSLTTGAAFAGTPLIDQRQTNQVNRIVDGTNAGQLSPGEATRLWKGQLRVQNLKNQAQANGVVTFRERARIHSAQTVQSARIFWNRRH
jgi:hypothetical protein